MPTMKTGKNYKMSTLFVIAAVVVAISAITIIATAPTASGFTDPALAAEGRGCLIYQTYPVQVDCKVPISPGSFLMV
jgi:hypothetical protein